VGHVELMGNKRNGCNVLVAKPGYKRPLGRTSHRWEDNIETDLRHIHLESVD
jgi:hypothetical protein